MTTYYDDMSESAALNYLAGTTDFGDAAAIRLIAAYIDAATGDGSPEGAVTGGVGDLYTDSTNGHLYIKASGTGNTGWVQLESATSGSGDVNGPGSATDNALVRFDGAGGKTVQNSGITVDDSGNITSDLTVSKATPALNVTGASGDSNVFVSGAAGTWRGMGFRTGSSRRWMWYATSTAESGSSAGSNFELYRVTDDSIERRTSRVERATGKATFYDVGATAGLELGTSGPRVMSGTGSPEGVVTAPVGSTWIDTAATTGAIKWVKATGTGNTGWVVEYGDTGWRNLAAESMSNAWTVVSSTFGLRRVGSTVFIRAAFSAASASGSTVYTLPSGFRSFDNEQWYVPDAASSGRRCYIASDGTINILSYVATTYFVSVAYATNDAWPTSLPGSAA